MTDNNTLEDQINSLKFDVAQLQQQLTLRKTEIDLLKETSNAISSQLHLDKLYQLVAEHARKIVNAKTLLIPLLDEDCDSYTYVAGCGENVDEIIGESLPIDFGVCGWVWQHKRPWWKGVLEELDENERSKWEKEAGELIMVPLIGKFHFLGGIAGFHKKDGKEFNQRDLDLLSMFASQVAMAMENARFFESMESAKKQAEDYQHKLENLNLELENKVKSRTSELVDLNQKLKQVAMHDSLTGLPNRTVISDRLKHGLDVAEREIIHMSVMMIDLDRFKEINDTLGHAAGDALLVEVGRRLQSILRKSDTVGRLGGDEFALILPGADKEQAIFVANKIVSVLEPSVLLEGKNILIEASIGISVFPSHANNADDLLKFADVAMYTAKRNGENYHLYDSSQTSNKNKRLELYNYLRQALDKNELELFYQPQLDVMTGTIIGVEALARWQHPILGFVSPAEFIPILEQSGLIKAFSHWVIDTALEACSKWQQMGLAMSVSINLSMRNLHDPELSIKVANFLNKWGLERGDLVLEMTEGALMHNPDEAHRVLQQLANKGIELSLDDFGTGYSSLSFLRTLPVKEIKIDRSFVMDMIENKDDATIVKSIIDLAHNLGHTVVAEGVETKEIIQELENLHCDMIQGFYISKALPYDELIEFITKGKWSVTKTSSQ